LTANQDWNPQTFLSYIRTVKSSSRVALIRTDDNEAYLKAINNPEGEQVLACDWFGTKLARRFGLKTFDVAMLELTDLDEIPLDEGIFAQPGLAFVSRAEDGNTMGGQKTLRHVENLKDIPRIVIFDTWVRNCDRYAPEMGREGQARMNLDNLFLSTEGASKGKFVLKAIDHGHIFTCGKRLNRNLAFIQHTREEKLYGLFPFLREYVTVEGLTEAAKPLIDARSNMWADLLRSIPDEWGMSDEARQAIDEFLLERARFVVDNIEEMARKELRLDMSSQDSEEGEQV
jgi:hypothetical protein